MKKRISLISFLVILVLSGFSSAAEVSTLDSLVFDELKHDFGDVKQGDIVEHNFSFENQGLEAVLITKVITQCGCTAPEYSKDPIASGDTERVLIKFDSKDKMGYQRKTIKVKTDTGQSVKLVILINII